MDTQRKIGISSVGDKFIFPDGKRYGGDQNDFPEKKYREKGCGVIALANLICYISRNDPMFFKKSDDIGRTDYEALCGEIKKSLPPDADGIRLMLCFKKLTGNSLGYYPLLLCKKEKLLKLLEEALSEDIPVIVSVFSAGKKNKGFELRGAGRNYYARAHYMTSTALLYENNKISVVLSSWGKRFIMDFDEYCKLGGKNPINAVGTGFFIPIPSKERQ